MFEKYFVFKWKNGNMCETLYWDLECHRDVVTYSPCPQGMYHVLGILKTGTDISVVRGSMWYILQEKFSHEVLLGFGTRRDHSELTDSEKTSWRRWNLSSISVLLGGEQMEGRLSNGGTITRKGLEVGKHRVCWNQWTVHFGYLQVGTAAVGGVNGKTLWN